MRPGVRRGPMIAMNQWLRAARYDHWPLGISPLKYARGFAVMAEPPGRRDSQPGRPPPTSDHQHGRQRLTVGLVLGVEGPQARDEGIWITAPVRMMGPDELPAATPCLVNLVFFHR